MNTYTVTASKNGFVQAVHHSVRAESAAYACAIAAMFHLPRARYMFSAELAD